MTYIGGVRLQTAMIVGALAGVGAGLVFATAHAIIIVPIWDRMLSGLAWGAAAGAVGGWTYAELYPESGAATGAKYGALLWLAVAPVTAVDAALRSTGILPRLELLGIAIAILLAVVMGAVLGWYRTGRRRGMIAGAAATLLLTLAMGGPVPAARSARTFLIFLAVLPASVVAGTLLGTAIALARRRTSPQETS